MLKIADPKEAKDRYVRADEELTAFVTSTKHLDATGRRRFHRFENRRNLARNAWLFSMEQRKQKTP